MELSALLGLQITGVARTTQVFQASKIATVIGFRAGSILSYSHVEKLREEYCGVHFIDARIAFLQHQVSPYILACIYGS